MAARSHSNSLSRPSPLKRRGQRQNLKLGRETWTEMVARGHPLRVYVPFGEHWHAYSLRRLRENPAIAGHVMRNLLTRP